MTLSPTGDALADHAPIPNKTMPYLRGIIRPDPQFPFFRLPAPLPAFLTGKRPGLEGLWSTHTRLLFIDFYYKPIIVLFPSTNHLYDFMWISTPETSPLINDGLVKKSEIQKRRCAKVSSLINGSLGGLVAITANCHCVNTVDAALIGAVAGAVCIFCEQILIFFRIDDAAGAVPVHLGCGIWGTAAVALFGDSQLLGTGLDAWSQLEVQIEGIGAAMDAEIRKRMPPAANWGEAEPIPPQVLRDYAEDPADTTKRDALLDIICERADHKTRAAAADPAVMRSDVAFYYGNLLEGLYVTMSLAQDEIIGPELIALFNRRAKDLSMFEQVYQSFEQTKWAEMMDCSERKALLEPIKDLIERKQGKLDNQDVNDILARVKPIRDQYASVCE